MKIALAHDWLNQIGGAENVLEEMSAMYPGAPVFTTIYAPQLMPNAFHAMDIRPTWLNRAPAIHNHHQPYLPLYPSAVSSMDFSGVETPTILAISSGANRSSTMVRLSRTSWLIIRLAILKALLSTSHLLTLPDIVEESVFKAGVHVACSRP